MIRLVYLILTLKLLKNEKQSTAAEKAASYCKGKP